MRHVQRLHARCQASEWRFAQFGLQLAGWMEQRHVGHTYEYVFPQIYQSENATRDRMPAFFGITKILKVEVMHRVTDYYGPIVYSHFADPEARYMPDTQKEVYNAFFCELDTAVAVLSDYIVEHPGASEFARFDMLLDR